MPVYFFHLKDELDDVRDDQGTACESDDAARRTAIKGVRSILAEGVMAGSLDLNGHIEIRDEVGRQVALIEFEEAVEIIRPRAESRA